ncbi:hypothetical protein [Flavobacterium olei]|uniref:hypothetical protein n=1 Tax=Flavobacterium olei TaxID=1886782 RepID=UPI00321AC821
MKINKIEEKIGELENWLLKNPNSSERNLVDSDLKELETLLDEKRKTRRQIQQRIALLYLALQFCSEKSKTFTSGERICINQERFQWMHILENETASPRPVSSVIENKIIDISKLALLYNFKPYYEDPLKEETEITL